MAKHKTNPAQSPSSSTKRSSMPGGDGDGTSGWALFALGAEGEVTSWPSAAHDLFGYTPKDAVGQPLKRFLAAGENQQVDSAAFLSHARENGSAHAEGWHQRKDGSQFWGTGMITPLPQKEAGFAMVVRDETQRIQLEEQLRRALQSAKDAIHEKDHFLATVSHELRTPLTATLLWAKLLNSSDSSIPTNMREGLSAIEQSAKEQQGLIDQLLDTSRIAAGKLRLNFSEVNLAPLAHAVLETIRPMAIEKEIDLVEELDANAGTVNADPIRLQQVLNNLLTNAIKFTPPGGTVTLRLEREDDDVRFEVIDTGQGISAEFLPRMFDRFVQGDEAAGPKAGLGLGLSITRQLVVLHGGTISVASPGLAKGSTFSVNLPLPKIVPARPASAPTKGLSLRGLKVLMVEDDPDTRRALTATLTRAGANVTTAESAPIAIEKFSESKPDVILSDIGLGEMSGHDLIVHIRAQEKAEHATPVPAIALTAYTDEKNVGQALRSGFKEVLSKPVESGQLLHALASLSAR